MTALQADMDFPSKGGTGAAAIAKSVYDTGVISISTLLCGAVVLGDLLAWLIALSITRPIARAVTLAEHFAAGDVSADVHAIGDDEVTSCCAP